MKYSSPSGRFSGSSPEFSAELAIAKGGRMKKTIIVILSVFFLFLALNASPIFAAAQNGCLVCHTSDATMKLLYKPPAGGPSEGEG